MSCGVGRRCGSELVLLWLAAAAPIQPLAWELPYTASVALKRKKKKEKRISGILFLAWYLVSLDEWCLQNLQGGILLVVFHPVTSGLFQIHLLLSLTLLYHNQPISKSLSLSTSLHLQPDLNYHQLSLGLCSPNFPSIDLCSI